MPFIRRFTISALSDTGGDYTGYTTAPVNGYVHAIQYVKSTNFLSTLGDLTVTGEVGGQTILAMTALGNSWLKFPRNRNTQTSTAGANISTGGSEKIPVCNERIKFVVATTVNTANKTGTFYVYMDGGA